MKTYTFTDAKREAEAAPLTLAAARAIDPELRIIPAEWPMMCAFCGTDADHQLQTYIGYHAAGRPARPGLRYANVCGRHTNEGYALVFKLDVAED